MTNVRPHFSLIALLALGITSCREEDLTLDVTCAVPDDATFSVEFGAADSTGRQIGLLDAFRFGPGAILQLDLAPSIGRFGRGRVAYTLSTSASDFLPVHSHPWQGKVVGLRFSLKSDSQEQYGPDLVNAELQRRIDDNTDILVGVDTKRKALRNPISLVVADNSAVNIVKNAAQTRRFALVSEVAYGKDLDLRYSDYSLGVNTLKDGNYYVHLKYSCAVLDKVNSFAQSSQGATSIILYYIPIRYDFAKGSIEVDTRAIDLSKIVFSPNTL